MYVKLYIAYSTLSCTPFTQHALRARAMCSALGALSILGISLASAYVLHVHCIVAVQ